MKLHASPLCTELLTCVRLKLRAAGEYDERKMIRAAIRQIRDEQQQGESSCLIKLSQVVSLVKYDATCLDKIKKINLFT